MPEKIGESMKVHDLAKGLEEYYQQRNNVLHGCKIPFSILEGHFLIPKIKGAEEDSVKWNYTMSWDNIKPNDFDFLENYMNDSYRGILTEVNSALLRLITNVRALVEKLKIKVSTPLIINTTPDTSACVQLVRG